MCEPFSPQSAICRCALRSVSVLVCSSFFLGANFAQETDSREQNSKGRSSPEDQTGPKYELPSGSLVIEEQTLKSVGHADRTFILWMVKPEKHPTEHAPDDPYTCPD